MPRAAHPLHGGYQDLPLRRFIDLIFKKEDGGRDMGDQKRIDKLLRQTFGHTTPMQSDERVLQAQKTFSREEMLEAGIPEGLHSVASYWATLEEMKEDLMISGGGFES